jgi:aryl-alcohol dehydrogenase-like predicted oxidoreductase
MKWLGSRPGIDHVLVGADTAQHFRDNMRAFENPVLSDAEHAALDKLCTYPPFAALKRQKDAEFSSGSAIGQRAAL